jgi:hypothetical protein
VHATKAQSKKAISHWGDTGDRSINVIAVIVIMDEDLGRRKGSLRRRQCAGGVDIIWPTLHGLVSRRQGGERLE